MANIPGMEEQTATQPLGALPLTTQPVLVIRKRNQRPSERAFAVFRRRVVEQVPAAEIMKEFTINRARVFQLVSRVTKWAKEHEGVGDVLAIKIRDTAALEELYREVSQQWRKSCQDFNSGNTVVRKGLATTFQGSVINLPDQQTTHISVKRAIGDARLAKLLVEIRSSIRGIWGADAPKQFQGTVESQSTLAVILARAERSAPAPTVETGNVIDVTAELAKIRAEHGG